LSQLFETLNPQQRKAASHKDGPLVVFAGAGSGKTKIITTRIAWLIEQGIRPWEILAVTFTNKAAGEMKARVESIAPESKRSLITTFHSACARWLREFAGELGFNSNFTIYDDNDTTSALKKIIKEANPQGELAPLVASHKSFIHWAKTAGMLPHEADKFLGESPRNGPPGAAQIYRIYQEYLAQCNAMDFGDLMLNMLLLLRQNETVRKAMTQRYQFILVDEFQDTNRTQFELVRILSERHGNLFVVGDDDQSIYSWRGATPSNILDFTTTFPAAQQVLLEENYRCTAHIVDAASAVVAHNKQRAPKTLFTNRESGELIDYHQEADGEMEAWWVADTIRKEQTRFPFDQVAVFYRTNSQSRSLEDAFRKANIPYTVYGSIEFYERMEVKDLMAYLRLIVNDSDEICLRRILNVPTRGLGEKALVLAEQYAADHKMGLLQAMRQLAEQNITRVSPKLRFFVDLFDALRREIKAASLNEVLEILIIAIEYGDYLKKKYPDQYVDKMDNIHELGSAMADFATKNPTATLEEWIQTVSLVRDESDDQGSRGVTLMTLHSAKGLEFDRVYLVGMEEGLLPHRNSMDQPTQLEEERRLLYVGMTRARKKLSLLSAAKRRVFNNILVNSPSRFLRDIPAEHLSTPDYGYPTSATPSSSGLGANDLYYELDEDDASQSPLVAGEAVSHPTYGRGRVERFEQALGQLKVIVNFFDFGLRSIRPHQLKKVKTSFSGHLD